MSWDVIRRYEDVAALPPAERAVADFYAASLPGAAFMNLRQVADAAGVSTASVTRFARRLGFTDFRDLTASLRDDARRVLERPGDRLGESRQRDTILDDRFRRASEDLTTTHTLIDRRQFAAAVDLLADDTRPLVLGAVASGRPLLEHVGLLLEYVRGDVTVLRGTDRWAHALAGLTARHVVLATAYDRDPLPILHLLDRARAAGATTITITNVAPSPLLTVADVALRLHTSPGTPFGSRVALLTTLEALVDGVALARGADRGRADAIEDTFAALDVHPPTGRQDGAQVT
ncbi:MAG: MurR/RpiR family transcriptional regulator [Mobilicoccus sp.]|nr:MurR/RpiR family transcriptional regulator [Mobilicoccus sp.]